MTLLSLLCLLAAAAADRFSTRRMQEGRSRDYPEGTHKAYLDNFHPDDAKMWDQRYYENRDECGGDTAAPIFLEIGGEGTIYGPPSGEDEIAVLARQHHAIILSLEHRFYGKSQPTGDLSVDSLRYLDDRQALEDVVHFIDYYDEKIHPSEHVAGRPLNKWVLFGGSYPGALASWIRTKYPHMSECSVSSSGVVEAIYKYTGFDEQVAKSAGPKCANLMRQVTGQMESLVVQDSDRKKLFSKLKVREGYDLGDFFYFVADSGIMAIQYGHMGELCGRLEDAYDNGTSLIDAYADYMNDYLYVNSDGPAIYDRQTMANEALPDNVDYISRQWQYQTCARFSWFQNAPAINSIRSTKYLTFDYFLDLCKAVFGIDMDPEVDYVNNFYGGKGAQARNVFYATYWQDPWHLASPDEGTLDASLNSPVMLVNCTDCGHCQDMYSAKDTDPAELTEVRQRISDFVSQCLNQ